MKKWICLFLLIASCSPSTEEQPNTEIKAIPATEKKDQLRFDLKRTIQAADRKKPDAIAQMVLMYRENASFNSPVHCDEDVALLKSFAIEVAKSMNTTIFLDTMTKENGKITQADERKLNRLGYIVNYVNEEPYLAANPRYLLDHLKPCVSSGMIRFLEEFDLETRRTAIEGEQMEIEVSELLRRVIFWEDFMNQYPEFVLNDEAKSTYHFYLSLYMTGTGNNRAFDSRTLLFNSDFKKSYEEFIRTHPRSPTAQFIEEYYTVLKENNFYYSTEVNAYYDRVNSPYKGK